MSFEKYISEDILEKGINLSSQGINEIIWKGAIIKDVINSIYKAEKTILGGDVYTLDNGLAVSTYDNWYYNGNNFEEAYTNAIQYITNYLERNGDDFYFSVTVSQTQ